MPSFVPLSAGVRTMRRTLFAAVFLLLPLSARTAEPGQRATLTPKEIADGWILLFDGQTTFGWTSPNGSGWTALNGMLAPQAGKPGLLVTTTVWSDYELALEYRARDRKTFRILLSTDAEGRQNDPNQVISGFGAVDSGRLWRLRLRCQDGHLTSHTEETVGLFGGGAGSKRQSRSDQPPVRGHIALAGNGFIVRNIKLRPLNTKPIFNGKNLDGWKKYTAEERRSKSIFSVTKEGWLSLKNGRGDLQTTGQWADFALQLECKTNGDRLNSGIFFRCLPGEYQLGYEAQIHNGFSDPPGKEYTLENYDPQTHKLKEKRKERYTASDYGTGAIYRRQPARFQMANDREWFAMTVAAQGRHLATWVNGVQVVDWTDNRPLAANAREGCYVTKGAISIQGHDPTTDLDFRNLRIAELPSAEKK
jgi:hypothetical protein